MARSLAKLKVLAWRMQIAWFNNFTARQIKVPLICLGLACAPLHAEVVKQSRLTHYAVNLVPNAPLLSQFNAASTVRTNGNVFHGSTHWQITWNFRWNADRQGVCRITSIETLITIDFVMPRVTGGTHLQRQHSDAYLEALWQHESGHALIGERAARAIDEAILALPPMRNCTLLETEANAKGHELLALYQEVNRRYDRETEHGKTQGALLSP